MYIFISDDFVSVFGCCNMVRIITNFYEVKIQYQKLLRFQSCKLVIEQNVVQNCIKYCGIKKGQIPCEIFHNSNQIAYSHRIPLSSSTFILIFCAQGLSHCYTEKEAVAGRSGEYSFQPFLNSFQPFLNSFTLPGNTGRSFKSFM